MQLVEMSKKGNPITDSRKVAEASDMMHIFVMADIAKMIEQAKTDDEREFMAKNFYLSKRKYIMTEAGFWLFARTCEFERPYVVHNFNRAFFKVNKDQMYLEREHIIYKYTSPSGKMYVGQTNNEEQRKKQHRKLNTGCKEFGTALMKYGYLNFEYEVLERYLTKAEANERETYFIKELNTLMPNGYNMVNGKDVKKNKKHGKYFKNLIAEVLENSNAQEWYEAKQEWVISEYEHSDFEYRCVCGNEGITHLYTIKNIYNGNEISPIGSTCIEKFEDDDMSNVVKLNAESDKLRFKYKTQRTLYLGDLSKFLINEAYKHDAFANAQGYDQYDEYTFLLKMFNKRKAPTPAQQRKINVIIAKFIIPYFTGDNNVKFIGQTTVKPKPEPELEKEREIVASTHIINYEDDPIIIEPMEFSSLDKQNNDMNEQIIIDPMDLDFSNPDQAINHKEDEQTVMLDEIDFDFLLQEQPVKYEDQPILPDKWFLDI